jgi:hypothetical protein
MIGKIKEALISEFGSIFSPEFRVRTLLIYWTSHEAR